MPGIEGPYYWDSCIFSAWLQGEERPDGEMEGIKYYVDRFDRGEISIITSTITYTEVLGSRAVPAGIPEMFDSFMQRPNIARVTVDAPIAKLARQLRLYFLDHAEEYNSKTIKTPDAIHLATAILNNVVAFHTFDSGGQSNDLGLLRLSGNVAGHRLIIEKPRSTQLDLQL